MDTLCRISIDARYKDILPEAEKIVKEYEARFSRHLSDSLLSQVNNDHMVTDDELAAIIREYNSFPSAFKDVFSISLGAVSDAWNIAGGGTVPSQGELRKLVENATNTTITVTDNRVRREGAGVIDLGGLLKGYICGQLSAFLRQQGVRRFIIDLGGNIAAYSHTAYTWKIGIKNPDGQGIIGYVRTDAQMIFVATSGNYQRYFERNGVRYHHILVPSTGYPVQGVKSVTVITENPMLSDMMSTALFVAGREHTAIASMVKENFAAVLVYTNNEFAQYNTVQEHDENGNVFWRY